VNVEHYTLTTYRRERTPGSWVGPRAGVDVSEKRKIFFPAGTGTPDRPGHSLVTTLTELPQLQLDDSICSYFLISVGI